ncbi:MAG TPA: di-heme oxidoredictase family protein [Polyangiales bacterium]|jgi:CxxC motif-containing protein (DUF1111 family)
MHPQLMAVRDRHPCLSLACAAAFLSLPACSDKTDDAAPSSGGLHLVQPDLPGVQLADLDNDQRARFNDGDRLFDQTFLAGQGLGPVYIRASCASCHANDGRGPGTVRKMVMLDASGNPLPDQSGLPYGNTVRPQAVGDMAAAIVVPSDTSDLLLSTRVPPAVFGRGSIEAVSDDEIMRVESEQGQRSDGVSGRINWVTYASDPNPNTTYHSHAKGDKLIGRFGLKARIATLDDFAADAFQGDMGITSDLRPNELPNPIGADDELPGVDIPADDVNQVADYMRMLRIPTRQADANDAGAALFSQAQCDACHVPTLHTQADYALSELADIDAPIYTDLLLHDMGSDFADGLDDYGALSSEWKTAPLMGLRFFQSYLHDGRAKSIEDAIEMHGGAGSEAAASIDQFHQLDDDSRAQLLKFVSAL